MRKMLNSVAVFMLGFLLFAGTGFALNLSPQDTSGKLGETVAVPVSISDTGAGFDLDAFSFTFSFDPNVLTYTEANKSGTLTESFTLLAGKIVEPGKVKVNGALFGSPVHVDADGVFLNLKFTVAAEETSALTISDLKDDIRDAISSPALFTPEYSKTLELPADAKACINSQDAVISVPLTLNNADSVSVESVDVKVKFDNTVLGAAGATLTGGVLADKNYEIVSQVNDAGEISAAIFANGNLFTGSGVIAYLRFYVTGELGDITPLTFAKAKLNEASVEAGSGSVEITECRYDISGNIGYYSSGVPVFGVLLELEGDEYRSATADEAGNYLLSDIPEGNYTLAPYKNDHFGGISGLDASRIAKYAAGFPGVEFTYYEKLAADVNLDGQITGLDASRVARYAAGKISYLNDEDIHWVFALPPSVVSGDEEFFRTYSPLNENKANQDFLAVRLGDVTGNWSDEPVREKRHSRSVCQVSADQGSVLTVPVVLNQETAVEGADISIVFDTDVLDFTGATLAGGILENSGYALLAGGTEGELKLVISANADAVTGSGETVFLNFEIAGEPGEAAVLSLTDFQVNETEVSGGFRINGKVCQQISLSIDGDTDIIK
jgi:hypothetical protein